MEAYEEIYERMKARYEELSGDTADEASDIAIRLRVLAGELYNMQTTLEWHKRQMFAETASGAYLDRLARQRGVSRREAAKAKGKLVFRLNETKQTAVTIPAGTVVATDRETPLRFYTTEAGEIPPNTYSAAIPAEAEQPGYNGNIAVNIATVPVSMPAEVDSVTNTAPFIGGEDREGDVTLRARLLESYEAQPNPLNAAYYKQLALSVEGVGKAGAVGRIRGNGTVNVYVAGKDSEADEATMAAVRALIQERRALGVDAQVYAATHRDYDMIVTVTPVAGYDADEITALLTAAFTDCLGAVPLGGRLYLSTLGKYLLDTGCIETYNFDSSMQDVALSQSMYFTPGDVQIEVTANG